MDAAAHLGQGVPARTSGKIGPNAVIQLGAALTARLGRNAALKLFARAGVPDLLDHPPHAMTDETVPAALYDTLWQENPDLAPEIASEAGLRTADYVIAHRIPWLAQGILRLMPRQVGARLLLKAIEKNAWTFAGSGHCEVHRSRPYLISITDNQLRMPDCVWHQAVFVRLFEKLIAPGTRVRHTSCCARGDSACRFEIEVPRV